MVILFFPSYVFTETNRVVKSSIINNATNRERTGVIFFLWASKYL